MKKDVIIIGSGAAGLLCAIEAGKRGRSVLLIEHAERLGNKILISGGGRCNFTNVHAAPDNFLSANPHFCKSALARYTPADFIALVERHGIRYHEKKLGQLFCDRSSREIVEMLQEECAAAHVEIRLQCRVAEVRKSVRFQLQTNQGDFECDSLVIATGGLSFPKLGATDLGYRIAQQFGLKLTEPRPGLVPLTLGSSKVVDAIPNPSPYPLPQGERQEKQRSSDVIAGKPCSPQGTATRVSSPLGGEDKGEGNRSLFTPAFDELSGVSVDSAVSCHGVSFRENILLTHRGLSGPAILQISNYCGEREPIEINLLPDRHALELLNAQRQSAMELSNVLSQHLPRRFVQTWCERFAPSRPMNRFSSEELQAIAHRLHHWEILPSGTEGYAKAEVTLGGVDTDELSSKTMESRRVPGLYFIGEVVDVTGWLGGYNFQWAWASGFAAGQVV